MASRRVWIWCRFTWPSADDTALKCYFSSGPEIPIQRTFYASTAIVYLHNYLNHCQMCIRRRKCHWCALG